MEAQQVINKILSEAQGEADRIKSEAQQKQAADQARLDKQLSEYKTQTNELAKKAGEDKKTHMLAAARMDIAKKYLEEKRKLLQEIFDKAKEQLASMPDEQYRQLMMKLMKAAVETGDEEVIVDSNEKRIDHELIKQVNRELRPGFHGNLRLSEERQAIGGGFVLRRGKIRNNVSLSVLIDEAKKELEIDLAKELFAGTQ
jgi:V/A-type H+-transporting ATPase subunit E